MYRWSSIVATICFTCLLYRRACLHVRNDTYDYIVVGAGNAGLVLAKRLAETSSYRVAVVEAGTSPSAAGNTSQVPAYAIKFDEMSIDASPPPLDWHFQTTPQQGLNGQVFRYSRGKSLGGCTAVNGLAYHFAPRETHERWASMVGDEAYKFENFLQYHAKVLNLAQPSNDLRPANASVPSPELGFLTDSQAPLKVSYGLDPNPFDSWAQTAFAEAGIPTANSFLEGSLDGAQYIPSTIDPETMQRVTAQNAYLGTSEHEKCSNLYVLDDTLVTRILFDSDKNAVGVHVRTSSSEKVIRATREVILSAGAFQSPQLLMVSGIGPRAELEALDIDIVADRPGVGQNLRDQPLFGIAHGVNLPLLSSLKYSGPRTESAISDYENERRGPLTRFITYVAFEKLSDKGNLSIDVVADLQQYPTGWPEIEYLSLSEPLTKALDPNTTYANIGAALLTATSVGNITLASKQMIDPPIINPNWLTSKSDQQLAIAAFRRIQSFWKSAAVQPILLGSQAPPDSTVQTDDDILAFIRKSFSTIWHATGTCAMGHADNAMSVVDNAARVIGVHKLRIVDASILPILIPGHPSATIYALAEMISDNIMKTT